MTKALASGKTVGLGAEGLALLAEIHNEGDVNVAVLKCHGGGHWKSGSKVFFRFFLAWSPSLQGAKARWNSFIVLENERPKQLMVWCDGLLGVRRKSLLEP